MVGKRRGESMSGAEIERAEFQTYYLTARVWFLIHEIIINRNQNKPKPKHVVEE